MVRNKATTSEWKIRKRFEEWESRMQKLDKNTTEMIGKLIEHVKNGVNPNNANKRKSEQNEKNARRARGYETGGEHHETEEERGDKRERNKNKNSPRRLWQVYDRCN